MLTLLGIYLIFPATAQENWKDQGLKGKIKSMTTQETYRYKKNGVDFTPWEKTYTRSFQFDRTGQASFFKETNADGSAGYRIRYTKQPKEKKIRQAYFGNDDKPTITKEVSLDDKGRAITLTEYNREGKVDRTYTYTYDAKGNRQTMSGSRADGTVLSMYTWTYNDRNQKTNQRLQTPGYADSYITWTYDEKGNQTGEAWYDGDKQLTLRFERVYDEKGNKVQESKYKSGNDFLSKVTWKYEYDKQGNWIRRTQYTATGEDFHLEERVMEYY